MGVMNQKSLRERTTMSADISVTDDGIVEAMYANNPAWHGLGKIYDPNGREAPDSATAIEGSNMGWDTLLEPLKLAADGKEVDGYFATVRSDNRKTLGIVSSKYNVLNNRDAFSFMDSLCMDGIIRYESAFALKGGQKVALLARMPQQSDEIAEGDVSLRYILLYNSHDGTSQLTLTPTSVRVVCANTIRIAIRQSKCSVSIRHSGQMDDRLREAKVYLSQFDEHFTLFRDKARVLASRQMSFSQAQEYIKILFPAPAIASSATVKRNYADKLSALTRINQEPANNLASIKGTFWSMFNTVTQFVDHNGKYRGNEQAKSERRFLQVVDGPMADFKNQAFELATRMAG